MHIIFVSSVAAGGSGASQRQLARRLADRGHRVELLAAAPRSRVVRPFYDRQVDLSTRLRASTLRPLLLAAQRPLGRRVRASETPDYPTWLAAVPENGYQTLYRRHRPDVVVASSIDRVSWRRLRAQLIADDVPSVLYIREASGLGHLTVSDAAPDLLLANAESHAERARNAGFECVVVPSVVEVDQARTTTTREVALLVNPIPLLGGDRLWSIAAARPDVRFAVQESGLMPESERDALHRTAADFANIEVRAFNPDPAAVFADARVLLVPHRVDNRPRVILEAQTNGIPVIASRYPGLIESVGEGGTIVDDTDEPAPWGAAIGEMWDDPSRYEALVAAANAHAQRDDVVPERIVRRFEALLRDVAREPHPADTET